VAKLGQILLQFRLNFGLMIKVNPCWSGTEETNNYLVKVAMPPKTNCGVYFHRSKSEFVLILLEIFILPHK
jgi:hypothetical protein